MVSENTIDEIHSTYHTHSIANNCNYDITWMRCARAAMLTRRALHAGSWYVGSGEQWALKSNKHVRKSF